MKLIKLNNIQANKIAGMYSKFHALDPVFVEENFFYIPTDKNLKSKYGIAKRYLKKLLSQGNVKIIDTANNSDPNVVKLKSIRRETMDEQSARIATRITKWDYVAKLINEEL